LVVLWFAARNQRQTADRLMCRTLDFRLAGFI
jgi:hypothetical protein